MIQVIGAPIIVLVALYLGRWLGLTVKPLMYLMIGLAAALYAAVAAVHVRATTPAGYQRVFLTRVGVATSFAFFVAVVLIVEATEWAEHRGWAVSDSMKAVVTIVIVFLPSVWMIARYKPPAGDAP